MYLDTGRLSLVKVHDLRSVNNGNSYLIESFSESRLSDPVGERGPSESTLRGDGG